VNQTEAFSIAARGSGLANGFCHMLPWPENSLAKMVASDSMDCSTNHSTNARLSPLGLPDRSVRGRHGKNVRSRARGRSRAGRAG
jgi:hypothetical protein